MKGRKHTPEQVVRKLREADRLFGEGKTVAEVAKVLEISEHTFTRWRKPVCSSTMRTARSRSSGGYFLAKGLFSPMAPPKSGHP